MSTFPARLLATVAAVGTLIVALPCAAADDATAGIWQKHEYSLHFMCFTTTYSCDGLEEKLKELLIWAGARKDAKSSGFGCDRPNGMPSKFASANLTFYTLAAAAPGTQDAVPATWQKVNWSWHRPLQLEGGDCELVEQFRDQVLPMFTTRNVKNQTHCVPHEDNPGDLGLGFEVLVPASANATPARSP